MFATASREQAAATRRGYTSPTGARATVDTYLGTNRALLAAGAPAADPAGTYPMAYIVAQAPGSELQAHFHQADQFQVFIAGSGRIGTHAVQAVTVHYAGAHSPYGPIVAGAEGLQYLTLRRSWDPGAQYMPQSAQKLRELPGRRHRIDVSDRIALEGLPVPAAGASSVQPLFHEEEMGAWLLTLGARAQHTVQAPVDRFVYLLAGEARVRSCELAAGACVFASGDEGSLSIAAGGAGATLLVTQFQPAVAP